MRNSTLSKIVLAASFLLVTASVNAQFTFTNSNSLLNETNMRSGCAVTVVDVNNDGLDDILRMDQSTDLSLHLQKRDGTFDFYDLGNISGGSRVWAMAAADIDHNGWVDVVTGTAGQLYLVKLSWNGSTVVANKITVPNSSYFVQNITFGDIDNDGWVDVFVCDDDDYSKIYRNNAGALVQTTALINTAPGAPQTYNGDPADSGNYGSVWTDFDNDGDLDLFVAHCRQSTSSSTDLRRKDRLFVNDGSNVYTEAASTYGIEVNGFKQTWTASFGDIDNDGDLDLLVTNHGVSGQIFLNDGSGNYSELTGSGFSTNFDPIESYLEDLDNDGYLDIIITGNQALMYHNNGDNTFTQVSALPNLGGMLSFATGDLNHDGKIDIFTSYGNVYNSPGSDDDVLYMNTTDNNNHFITFDLEGTISDVNAIGARVTITGPWGTQVREVRSGESYGTTNSAHLHFGLGQNTTVTSAEVWFPSGTTITLTDLDADQFVTVVESSCSISDNVLSGSSVICTGQSTTLTAANGYGAYLWNNGETTQSINVTTAGTYNVSVTNGACTNVSPLVSIEVSPDETPTVTSAGDLTFCAGGSVELTGVSSTATAYSWAPNGETTATITATEAGTYSLTIQGACGSYTSSDVVVATLAANPPTAQDVYLSFPQSTTLTATGNNPQWYDMQTGGTLLGTGNTYTTPVLNSTTTFYVEDIVSYPGSTYYTGMTDHSGNQFSGDQYNAITYLDVSAPCILKSAKVYTDTQGEREFQLFASDGTTLLQSITVDIPVGESRVDLNFILTPGTDYELTTNGTLNNTNFGFNSPRLRRNNSGASYPYTITDLLSITGSDLGSQYYYYLYDWEVEEAPKECVSERIPVLVDVATGINTTELEGINLFPNPAKGRLFITLNENKYDAVFVNILDLGGRAVSRQAFYQTSSSQNLEIGLNDVAEGIYMVKVMADGNENIYKVVVK